MKKCVASIIILIFIIATGCTSNPSTLVTVEDVIAAENTDAIMLKEALNSLDESSDDLSVYEFYKYSKLHKKIVDDEAFKDTISGQVDFYYAKKGSRLVLVFPPKLELIGENQATVEALFNTSYIMDGNKVVISTKMKAEEVKDDDIERLIEMIAVSIKL